MFSPGFIKDPNCQVDILLALWFCHIIITLVPSVYTSFVLQIKARLKNPFCNKVASLQSQITEDDFNREMIFIKSNIDSIKSISLTNCQY